jgi:ribose transport system substrate-binding protein
MSGKSDSVDDVLARLDTRGVSRRSLLKLIGAGASAAAAGGLLAACGDDGGSSTAGAATSAGTGTGGATLVADGSLAFLVMTNQLQYDVQMDQAAGAVAKQLGYNYASYDGRLDASLQLTQFQQAAARGVKGILLHSPDGSNVEGIAKAADQQGIYLTNVWGTRAWLTPFDVGDHWTLYAQPDEYLVQGKVVQLLIDALGGSGTIVRVSGVPGNSADTIRTAGAAAVLKRNPGVKLAGDLPGRWNPEDSQKAMESLLSRFPDTRGVIAQNDDVATGVIAAIKAAGKKPGEDILVVGADGTDLAAQRIKSGEQLGTTANVPAYAGYLLLARLFDLQNGWRPRVPERMLQWESVILTKDNVDPYLDRYVGDTAAPPFSIDLLSHVKAGDRWDPQFKLYPIDDLDRLWEGNDKPSGWKPPAEFTAAQQSGEFETVAKEYAAAYRADVLGPSPAA